MGNSKFNYQTSMGDSKSSRIIQHNGEFSCARFGRYKHRSKNYYYRKSKYKLVNFFKLSLLLLLYIPKTLANTVSSPSASSSGTVINNGYQTINGGFPTMIYGGQVQCQQPTLAFTPFVTKGENYASPTINTTKTNIYDLSEDASGNLVNPGKILYQSEQPRIDQSTHNFNYGFTLSFQVPLGRGTDLCLKAAENQIKGQEFVLARQKLEANLARMKVCAEQFKLGVKLVGEDAVACKNVVLTTIPNQVVPHTHELKTK
tara:strand:- start:76 stop:852 length:777 start_codon:yes stop_codon:yes gene_type:complete